MNASEDPRWTVEDAVKSADLFLKEAQQCADLGMGYAALMTAFPVVLAIGEDLARHLDELDEKDPSVQDCIAQIFPYLSHTWYEAVDGYLPERHTERDRKLVKLLTDVRNGLVHALALPSQADDRNNLGLPSLRVCLVDAPDVFRRDYSDKYRIAIIPSLFVEAISRTVRKLDSSDLQIPHDAVRAKRRSPTNIIWGATTSASGTTASGINYPDED